MPLTIDAPDVESRLQKEAARRGISAADYARQLLESSLAPQDAAVSAEAAKADQPAETGNGALVPASLWPEAFDAWIDGHPRRSALPEHAFERASFYPDKELA